MAKRSVDTWERELDDQEEDQEEVQELTEIPEIPETPDETPITKRLRLLKNVKLKYVGRVTGNLYIFEGAGRELDVDIQDADEMLAKKSNAPCCKGSGIGRQTPYFEEVR